MTVEQSVSLEEMKAFRKQRYEESLALIDRKGADYNREQQKEGDTLFNLKVAAILGLTANTSQSILVRILDKVMRLISLTKPGVEAAVKEESVLDTINDLHNYADFLGLTYLKSKQSENTIKAVAQTNTTPGNRVKV